jgi:lipopolysaccharide/colanic/teichoic acid biosynthesis glycosyltransferase
MTGLLQINERDTDDFDVWYKYDIEYIENWTLYLDFKILLKTFKAVIEKSNAGK